MKKISYLLFVIAFFFLSFKTQASHLLGAKLNYEQIAHNQYLIKFTCYAPCVGPGTIPNNPEIVNFKNNCGYTGQLTLSFYKDTILPGACDYRYICLGGNVAGVQGFEFRGIFTIPDSNFLCQNWTVYWARSCCFQPNYTFDYRNTIYLETTIDGYINNSAPEVSPILPEFCSTDSIHQVDYNILDQDGDSLYFEFDTIRRSVVAFTSLNAPMSYTGGSPFQPGNSSIPFKMDSSNGSFTFKSAALQLFGVGIKISEYRGNYFLGHSSLVFLYSTKTQPYCLKSNPTYQNDTLWMPYLPNQQSIQFEVKKPILCNSVTSEGSEFQIFDSKGDSIKIKSMRPHFCDTTSLQAKKLIIFLEESLPNRGTYYLYSKIGSDSNTVVNACHYEMSQNDTLVIIYGFPTGVSNIENNFDFRLSPNPNEGIFDVHFSNLRKPSSYQMKILDLQGKLVYQKEENIQNQNFAKQYNCSFLKSGVYFIEIEMNGEIIREKMVLY